MSDKPKFCKDCKYHIRGIDGGWGVRPSTCQAPENMGSSAIVYDLVSGEVNRTFEWRHKRCREARELPVNMKMEAFKCGPEAKWFQPLEEVK